MSKQSRDNAIKTIKEILKTAEEYGCKKPTDIPPEAVLNRLARAGLLKDGVASISIDELNSKLQMYHTCCSCCEIRED